jgi:uncharacterized protein involved in exopolysaccharide biosynthesis
MVNDLVEKDDFAAINLLKLWSAIASQKLLIAIVAVLTPAIAVGLSYLLKPTFRADTVLAAASSDKSAGGLGGLLGQYGGLASLAGIDVSGMSKSSINESLEILRSRAFTEKFITEMKLMPVLFPEKSAKPPTMWDAYKRFNGLRKTAKDMNTGFVKLSIEWHDPKAAAEWANGLVRMLNDHLRARTIEESTRSINYLQEQLDTTVVTERRQMLVRLMESETQKIVLAQAQDDFAMRVLDRAVVPQEKVAPKRLLILVSAFLGGLFLGIIIALLRAWLKAARAPRAV